ncbi:MAG: radical SAM protein [Desulfurococcaceae archaeon]
MKIRVSIGSLAKLGLIEIESKYLPSTLYILQYSEYGCSASCKYCTQSRFTNIPKKFLSRITWYPIEIDDLIKALNKHQNVFKRICIQTILKRGFIEELIEIIESIRNNNIQLGLSIALTPVDTSILNKLAELEVEFVGVGLDASSPRIFKSLGKPYDWLSYMKFIDNVTSIWGRATIHIIVGLGESIEEYFSTARTIIDKGCTLALFPHVDPLTMKPSVEPWYYRLIQLITYMVERGYCDLRDLYGLVEEASLNPDKYIDVFLTRGCPGCDRPYYTENPRGPFYNIYSHNHYAEYRNRLILELSTAKKMLGTILSA